MSVHSDKDRSRAISEEGAHGGLPLEVELKASFSILLFKIVSGLDKLNVFVMLNGEGRTNFWFFVYL